MCDLIGKWWVAWKNVNPRAWIWFSLRPWIRDENVKIANAPPLTRRLAHLQHSATPHPPSRALINPVARLFDHRTFRSFLRTRDEFLRENKTRGFGMFFFFCVYIVAISRTFRYFRFDNERSTRSCAIKYSRRIKFFFFFLNYNRNNLAGERDSFALLLAGSP